MDVLQGEHPSGGRSLPRCSDSGILSWLLPDSEAQVHTRVRDAMFLQRSSHCLYTLPQPSDLAPALRFDCVSRQSTSVMMRPKAQRSALLL